MPQAPYWPATWSYARLASFGYITLMTLAALLAWDASGLDLTLAHWYGSAQGFPLHEDWFLSKVLHTKAQQAGWVCVIALAVAIRWPFGVLRQINRSERIALLAGILAALLVIITLKGINHTSCPWDLTEFGGRANYVSHWALRLRDGGPGQCFPGGHASTGFALIAGYFALQHTAPHAARVWLTVALVLGFGLGWVQQMRGAHFMSHNLWTGWLCWTLTGLLDAGWRQVAQARRSRLVPMG